MHLIKILKALELSNSNEFINKFEKGIYTQVGERGMYLSGVKNKEFLLQEFIKKTFFVNLR